MWKALCNILHFINENCIQTLENQNGRRRFKKVINRFWVSGEKIWNREKTDPGTPPSEPQALPLQLLHSPNTLFSFYQLVANLITNPLLQKLQNVIAQLTFNELL